MARYWFLSVCGLVGAGNSSTSTFDALGGVGIHGSEGGPSVWESSVADLFLGGVGCVFFAAAAFPLPFPRAIGQRK